MSLRTVQHPVNHRGKWPHRLAIHRSNLLAFLSLFLLMCVHSAAFSAATTITPESLSVQRAEIERTANLPDEQKNVALAKIDESRALLDEAERFASRTQAMLNRIREAPEQLKKLRQSMDVAELKLDPADLDLWTNEQLEVVLSGRQLRLVEIQDSFAEADRVLGTYLALARTGGGGSSRVTPYYSVSPLEGLQNVRRLLPGALDAGVRVLAGTDLVGLCLRRDLQAV